MTIALSIAFGLVIGVPIGAILQTCWTFGRSNQYQFADDEFGDWK